ncbi:amino acid adenylation domain-containing protein, partial [Roseiflexus sp.]|uniref:amino acid adenylation domain-containing protein n=1 Tax=Roseiflexus sp. TaxID=2562120 RepID=UPI00398A6DD1
PIRPLPRDGRRFPLSFAQQRLWFLDQLEPESPFYNIPEVVRLRGQLDLEALEQALNVVARRQEALRMRIVASDGQPALVIEPPEWIDTHPIRVWMHNLGVLPVGEREVEAFRLVRDEAQHPFRLEDAPLLRATVIRLTETEHVLALVMHHIIGDAWSSGILVREVTTAYKALTAGRMPVLPDLPVQYADYAVWQREWLQGEALEQRLAYWRTHLSGLPPLLDLPVDRPRPAVQTYNGAHTIITLSPALNHDVRALAQREGATLFMILLTAFATLLRRYSGQEEFAIGVPVAGRSHAEMEGVIGFFVNTLALRMNLTGHPSFREALQQVRATALDAYAHQDVPFEMVVDALQPERSMSHTPIFQVMMVMQHARMPAIDLPDLTLSPIEYVGATSHFDLTLVAAEQGADLTIAFEYNTDLFDEATIERVARHFQTLLEGAVASPDTSIDRLPLLSREEYDRLLIAWNATDTLYPTDQYVHERIARQAQRTPTATAVITDREQWTYADLDRCANQLAHYLRQHGVGPETIVALALERSPAWLVSMLAVLKAGGAFLPLDPRQPPTRLRLLLADAQPRVLLTTRAFADDLVAAMASIAAATAPVLITLDAEEAWRWQISDPPDVMVMPSNAAYVIYTSGSTGMPKGVVVEHRNLINHNHAIVALFDLQPSDRILQVASPVFDMALEETLPALTAGATIVLRPDPLPSAEELLTLIERYGITLLDIPTAVWQAWTDDLTTIGARVPDCVRLVTPGGEAALSRTYRAWRGVAPVKSRWLNSYGPTETTISASFYEPERADEAMPVMPIGRPMPNTRFYVLDPQRQPVPIGVAGELYIAGAGVARGYLNRPALTAERFVDLAIATDCPDMPVIRCRAYRTGDRVRWRADGNLEFLGRFDDQVKVRGFRIELGEITATLLAHPAVRDAVVVVQQHETQVRLIAYVVGIDGVPSDLDAFVSARLPAYMIPAAYVALEALPRLASGKVDVRSLPSPEASVAGDDDTAPRGAVETRLAAIWAEVLGVARVGRTDNFFALGGDSILSIQVVARARQAGIAITPRGMFQARTLADLAQLAAGGATPQLAEQGLVTGTVPLTPIQRWFFAQPWSNPHHWNQSLLFETRAPLDRRLLEAAVARLVEHHDALRLRFACNQESWQQTNAGFDSDAPPPEAQVEWVDLSACTSAELPAAIEAAAAHIQSSLNITQGPIARVAYFHCGAAGADRLLIVVHHLAVDGVSWQILLEDLQTAYRHLAAGDLVHLPPKTTSFRAWAERLTTYASSEEISSELDYWRALYPLPGIPGLDRMTPESNLERLARRVQVALSASETETLLREAPTASGAEVQDVLLTALAQTLVRWIGRRPVAVTLEAHGREPLFDDLDLSRTVGWFTTIFPVLLDPGPTDDPIAALKAIKEQVRRVPRRGIGYGVLRYLSAALPEEPLPPISFNYFGQVDRSFTADMLVAPARERRGPEQDPDSPRAHLIDVTAVVVDGCLDTEWTYSAAIHDEQTIRHLANTFITAVQTLIGSMRGPESAAYTPSDFALAGLDQRQLDRLIARIGRSKESIVR